MTFSAFVLTLYFWGFVALFALTFVRKFAESIEPDYSSEKRDDNVVNVTLTGFFALLPMWFLTLHGFRVLEIPTWVFVVYIVSDLLRSFATLRYGYTLSYPPHFVAFPVLQFFIAWCGLQVVTGVW